MKYFQINFYRILIICIFILFLFSIGCFKKQKTIFIFNDIFEKTVTIALDEAVEMPEIIFTDFGFYTFEGSSSKISKYKNSGEFELSFGKKGSGPGEIELGIPVSYSEVDNKLGIFDVIRYSISYFDSNGEFLNYGKLNIIGNPHFQINKRGVTVSTFTTFTPKSKENKYTDVITINDEKILEKKTELIDDLFVDFYLYSINNNTVYILERIDNNFDVFLFNIQDKQLHKIEIDKSQIIINAKKRINSFFSIDDYLILSVEGKSRKPIHYVFDLKGKYLGIANFENGLQAIIGSYNSYLYVYRISKQDKQMIDVYSIKEK